MICYHDVSIESVILGHPVYSLAHQLPSGSWLSVQAAPHSPPSCSSTQTNVDSVRPVPAGQAGAAPASFLPIKVVLARPGGIGVWSRGHHRATETHTEVSPE